ncbi:MAG: hypothetical protein WBR26_16025 [Candidatus Acidiferrum sp.]
MRHSPRILLVLVAVSFLPALLPAQGTTGAIDLSARVTATGAQPEPVRQFPFYVLTRSYADVVKEVEGQDVLPTRDEFIDKLTCSPELKAWLKAHDIVDLTSPDLDKLLTVNDIMKIPEFFAAYERSNSGGVTKGLPLPKYREADKDANPERYQKQKEEFLAATRKFIETHPGTVQGIELELTGVNPKTGWDNLHLTHKSRITQIAPDTAQVKYLAGKAQTDLDGHAIISGLAPGTYWVSTLGADASSGDRRLVWDVPVTVRPGQATHIELTNLNAVDTRRLTAATP